MYCYADDILLLSVVQMQKMLDICASEVHQLDLRFNANKSFAIRIGPRHKHVCSLLTLDNNPIAYMDVVKYLGIMIKSGKVFACTFEHAKLAFYRALNALIAKSKAANSEMISVQLMKSFCLPLITYAIEVSCPSPSNL